MKPQITRQRIKEVLKCRYTGRNEKLSTRQVLDNTYKAGYSQAIEDTLDLFRTAMKTDIGWYGLPRKIEQLENNGFFEATPKKKGNFNGLIWRVLR